MIQINFNLYYYFFAVMQEGNISKASTAIGCSQPTVTYSIKELERDLNTKLFHVGQKGAKPTAEAHELYQALRPHYYAMVEIVTTFTR